MKIDVTAPSDIPPVYQTMKQSTDFKNKNNDSFDILEISEESRHKSITDELTRMQREADELKRQLERAKEQGDAVYEAFDIKLKCLIIAMRIIKGDEVPLKDYQFLAKNDMDLYSKAVSMRMENDNPKKHKRLSKDEEIDNGELAQSARFDGEKDSRESDSETLATVTE